MGTNSSKKIGSVRKSAKAHQNAQNQSVTITICYFLKNVKSMDSPLSVGPYARTLNDPIPWVQMAHDRAIIEAYERAEQYTKGEEENAGTEERERVGNLPETEGGKQGQSGNVALDRAGAEEQRQRKLGNDRILHQLLEATKFVNEVREKMGLGGFETEISDTASFYASELAAQASNPYAGFVTVKTEEELKDCLLIKVKGKNIGVAITPDGSCCLAYG